LLLRVLEHQFFPTTIQQKLRTKTKKICKLKCCFLRKKYSKDFLMLELACSLIARTHRLIKGKSKESELPCFWTRFLIQLVGSLLR
jgi:hypothetical protein